MDEQPSGDSPDPQDDTQQPMPEPAQETTDENQDLNMEDESALEESVPEENVPVDMSDVSEDSPAPEEAAEVSQDSNWSAEPEQAADTGGVNIAVKGPEQVEEGKADEAQEPAIEQNQEENIAISEEPGEEPVAEEEKPAEVIEVHPEQVADQEIVDTTNTDPPQPLESELPVQPDIPEDGVPLEDTDQEAPVASFIPAPVTKSKPPMRRWWIALAAFILVAAAGVGAYFLFFLNSDMTEYRNSTLAFSYPKDWNFVDQDQGGLAFYPGKTLDSTNAIFLVFANTSAIDGYSQMTADQKSQVKTRLLEYFVSPEFAEEINGEQGSLEFSNGQEATQKGADMALNFDANGSNSAGLASTGVLRVLIGPGGENVTLLAIALKEDWTANQNQYLDIVSNLQVL
jgi:hypothetical protein